MIDRGGHLAARFQRARRSRSRGFCQVIPTEGERPRLRVIKGERVPQPCENPTIDGRWADEKEALRASRLSPKYMALVNDLRENSLLYVFPIDSRFAWIARQAVIIAPDFGFIATGSVHCLQFHCDEFHKLSIRINQG